MEGTPRARNWVIGALAYLPFLQVAKLDLHVCGQRKKVLKLELGAQRCQSAVPEVPGIVDCRASNATAQSQL